MKNDATILLPVALLAVLTAPLPAQLTGSYTIDNGAPTGAGNYATFQAAANDLMTQGIVGPVTFTVATGVSIYQGFEIPTPISGSGGANVITFVAGAGQSPEIAIPQASTGECIKLGISSTLATGPTDIVIDGLKVSGALISAGIMAAGCQNIVVQNCQVTFCGTGIYYVGTTGSVISHNTVWFCANTVSTPGSATYAGAIALYLDCDNCVVDANEIFDCLGNGIFIGSSGSTNAPDNCLIYNNIIRNVAGAGSYPGGLAIRRSDNSIFTFNSIYMPYGSTQPGINQTGTSTAPVAEISNNVVRHLGFGPCIRFDTTTVGVVPTLLDYNLYDPGPNAVVGRIISTDYPTLASWVGVTAPSLTGQEANSIQGDAGFISNADLHIVPCSDGFANGVPSAGIMVDFDGDLRPLGGGLPSRGADEAPLVGLCARFAASLTTGPAPLTVTFADLSQSADPGGILSWAWDFDNDGTVDDTTVSPTYTYAVPGIYSVALTVTDASNPASTSTRLNYIDVGDYAFQLTTSAPGAGDLTIIPVPSLQAPNAFRGYTFASFLATPGVSGIGPWFGIVPDALTLTIAMAQPSPGNPLHFIVNGSAYPDAGSITLGPVPALVGLTMDGVMVFFNVAGGVELVTNTSQVSF